MSMCRQRATSLSMHVPATPHLCQRPLAAPYPAFGLVLSELRPQSVQQLHHTRYKVYQDQVREQHRETAPVQQTQEATT